MRLDETLTKILTTIKEEVKVKYNKEYSIDELNTIVETQFETTKIAFSKSLSIKWSFFCKFIFTNRYNRKMDLRNTVDSIKDSEDYSELTKEQIVKNKIVQSAIAKENYIRKANESISKNNKPSIEEVLNTPNVHNVNTPMFINITKMK